jgi:hypothetical protein
MPDTNYVASLQFKVTWSEKNQSNYEEQIVMQSGESREEVIQKLCHYGLDEEEVLEFEPKGKVTWNFLGIRYLIPVIDLRQNMPFITRSIEKPELGELIYDLNSFKKVLV